MNLELEVPVLIVGAGPAGLACSLVLGRYGVRSLLIERRSGTSVLPRATGVNMRTMEILRTLGLAQKIAAASMDVRGLPIWVELETLAGPAEASQSFAYPSGLPREDFPSPEAHLQCAQDVLEPLLLEAARSHAGCEVRFGAELLSFEQDADGVSAQVLERESGRMYRVRTSHLVAADGANSQVRSALGIPIAGEEHLGRELGILFEADFSHLVREHRAVLYLVRNALMQGTFRPVDDVNRWTLSTPWFDGASAERCAEVIRAGAGDASAKPVVVDFQEWELGAATAERFRDGRVFLVGDAAHRTTPGGAMGMNTAVQDVHNLAWKLAAVEQGWGGPSLLDTYEVERRPVALRNVALSLEIWRDMGRAARTTGAVLGFSYESEAVVPDGTPPPDVADPVAGYVPSARPGGRAPHCWIELGGRRISTLDLFEGRFALLSPDPAWCAKGRNVADGLRVPLAAHEIRSAEWAGLYGVDRAGAVLVRPDGHVGWRTTRPRQPEAAAIEQALGSVLGRECQPLDSHSRQ